MFFRNTEKRTVLDLDTAGTAGELTAGRLVPATTELSIEERVKQYFEQMREPVFRYVSATFGGERGEAEEITQDAFLQLYRYLNEGGSIQNVRAWTFRVAHNLAVNRIRQQQFIAPMSDEDWDGLQSTLVSGELNPEQSLLQQETLDRLRRAIGQLTLTERECLNLRTKGFRYREIAEILGLGIRTVSHTLYRVIDKLAKELNGQ